MDYLDNENLYGVHDLVRALSAGQTPEYISAKVLDLPVWGIIRQFESKDDEGYEVLAKKLPSGNIFTYFFFSNKNDAEEFASKLCSFENLPYRVYKAEQSLKEALDILSRVPDQNGHMEVLFNIGGIDKHLDLKAFVETCSCILQRDAWNAFLMTVADLNSNTPIDPSNALPFETTFFVAGERIGDRNFVAKRFLRDGDPIFEGEIEGITCFVDELDALMYQEEGLIPAYQPVRIGRDILRVLKNLTLTTEPGIEIVHEGGRLFLNPDKWKLIAEIYANHSEIIVGNKTIEFKQSIRLRPDELLALEELLTNTDWIKSFELAGGIYDHKEVEVILLKPKENVSNLPIKLAAFRRRLNIEVSETFLARFDDSVSIDAANRPVVSPDDPNRASLTIPFVPEFKQSLS